MITALVEVLHAARRRAEANERWLSAVLSSIGDAVIATDGQGRVVVHQSGRPVPDGVGRGRGEGQAASGRFRRRLGRRPPAGRAPVARVIREGVMVEPGQSHRLDRPRRDRATDRRQRRADQRP